MLTREVPDIRADFEPHDVIELNCLEAGDPKSNIFTVHISAKEKVAILKDKIKEKKKPKYDHVPADNLLLWTGPISIDDDDFAENTKKDKFAEEDSLLPVKRLSGLFKGDMGDDDVHVIVKAPLIGRFPSLPLHLNLYDSVDSTSRQNHNGDTEEEDIITALTNSACGPTL